MSTLQRYGFANRQILHFADVDEMEKNPGDFKFNLGRWIWEHDPAKYARDNFSKALKVIVYGGEFENTNLPLGHKYVPWTVESELEREKQGLRSTLYDTGDWDASTSPSMTKESSGEW